MSATSGGPCAATEVTLERGVRALRLENDRLAATVIPDKGADIYQLIDKRTGIDVLWKSPWGLKGGGAVPSAADSTTAWLEAYEGGWQEIFPSGGGPCTYRGVELNFHGEASLAAWDHEVAVGGGAEAELRLRVRLRRSPFLIERVMRVEAGRPALTFQGRITNQGGERLEVMWGHHPAFGAPFLGPACRVDTNARAVRADDAYDVPHNPLTPDGRYAWPLADTAANGAPLDLSRVPAETEERQLLAYLHDFDGEHGWYGLTNTALGLGVGLVWPTAVFPHAWFWQEVHGTSGFPWYREAYVMAIEPFSSIPGQGLVKVIEKTGTQLTIEPGESVAADLSAVFYESSGGITGIEPDGTVRVREG
jgi:hypothetical protein